MQKVNCLEFCQGRLRFDTRRNFFLKGVQAVEQAGQRRD